MNGPRHHDALTRALRLLAADEEALGASREVEARLLSEAHVLVARRRRRVYMAAGAVAATILAPLAVPAWRSWTARPPAVNPDHSESSAGPAAGEIATEFFPLMYSNVPVTNGQAVRLELPQAALASFGLDPGDVSDTVLADVLVGQDGLARAVRFVRPAMSVKEPR